MKLRWNFWLRSAAVLVTGLFIITFIMQAFAIPSSSMEDTLLIGDHVFVNRVQFAPRTAWLGPLFLIARSGTGISWCFFLPRNRVLRGEAHYRAAGRPHPFAGGAVYRNGLKAGRAVRAAHGPEITTRIATIFRRCRFRLNPNVYPGVVGGTGPAYPGRRPGSSSQ